MLDLVVAAVLLVVLAPLIAVVALAIKLDSAGPVFYRCARTGYRGRQLRLLKFRKMRDGAAGPALTAVDDERFTRLGRLLAASKLDEVPQLWNVLRGDMSLVGPRPEDPQFVAVDPVAYDEILAVKPGITGLSQLAFTKESEVLARYSDIGDAYVVRLLPQKTSMDRLYAARRSVGMDLRILGWTFAAVLLDLEVAVHRETGRLNRRLRPKVSVTPVPVEQVESS